MVASCPDATGAEKIRKLSEFEYDYAELPLAEMMALDAAALRKIRADLAAVELRCEACNNFFPRTMRLTGEDADPAGALEYAKRALQLAAGLGVETVVFGSGGAKNVPDGFPMEKGYEQVVALLRAVAPAARDNGITIAIEPLRKAECNLINTYAQGAELAKDVGEQPVRCLVDFYHLTEEQEPVDDIVRDAAYLHHVHLANPKGRVYPAQIGEAEYLPFIGALRSAGYSGRISCEAYAESFEREAPVTKRLLDQYFNL